MTSRVLIFLVMMVASAQAAAQVSPYMWKITDPFGRKATQYGEVVTFTPSIPGSYLIESRVYYDHRMPPDNRGYVAYGYRTVVVGCGPGDIFFDGFESGDVSRWGITGCPAVNTSPVLVPTVQKAILSHNTDEVSGCPEGGDE